VAQCIISQFCLDLPVLFLKLNKHLLSPIGSDHKKETTVATPEVFRARNVGRRESDTSALLQVYHSMGNYKQALQCYLGSESHPEAAFRFLHICLPLPAPLSCMDAL